MAAACHLTLNSMGDSEDLAAASKRLAALQQRAEVLKPGSTPAEVLAALGEPAIRGVAGWSDMETSVWYYVSYTDDTRHLSFNVTFDRTKGTVAGGGQTLRREVAKAEKRVELGTVLTWSPLADSPEGFLCDVKFEDGTSRSVLVETLLRVRGTPKAGSRLRLIHHGAATFNFVGWNSLFLASIEFAPIGAPAAEKK